MRTFLRIMLLLALAGVGAFAAAPARAQNAAWPAECQQGALPSGDLSYPADQQILVCIPQNWNGVLVVYAHGYVAPQASLALPIGELTLSNGKTVPEVLLPLGFAFATTSYHKNGYAIEQAGNDINALVSYVKGFAPVQRVLIAGASEGGLITAMLVERFPETYAGGLALCGPVGGMPYQTKYLGDFRVVFDSYFPNVFDFGATDVPLDAYQSWGTEYVPAISNAILTHPRQTNDLFRVTQAARNPLDPRNSAATTAITDLYYSVWGTNDLIATAGGQPYDNRSTIYRGSSNDLALNAKVERVTGSPVAQQYIAQFYQTTGQLQRPLVTMHTLLDPAVPFAHELIYANLTANAGQLGNLTVLPVLRYGHCTFTADEVLGAFGVLVAKVSGTALAGLPQHFDLDQARRDFVQAERELARAH